MARARTQPDQGALICPECGRTFERPAALGAHRRAAHGVAGTSGRSRSSRNSRRAQQFRDRSVLPSSDGQRGQPAVDRDALLQSVFPQGIPAREEALRAAHSWLDEAERLASMR